MYLFAAQAHVLDEETFKSFAALSFRRAELRDGKNLSPFTYVKRAGPIVDGRATEVWMATATEV